MNIKKFISTGFERNKRVISLVSEMRRWNKGVTPIAFATRRMSGANSKWIRGALRRRLIPFIVDFIALNTFVIATAFFVEVVFSGIALIVFLKGRLIMIIPNMITVEPYNRTRVWIGRKLGKWKSSHLHQIIRDTLVFILYRVPLVFIVLTFLGSPVEKVISACIVATLVSGFTGRPYGIFLDWVRRVCKVT